MEKPGLVGEVPVVDGYGVFNVDRPRLPTLLMVAHLILRNLISESNDYVNLCWMAITCQDFSQIGYLKHHFPNDPSQKGVFVKTCLNKSYKICQSLHGGGRHPQDERQKSIKLSAHGFDIAVKYGCIPKKRSFGNFYVSIGPSGNVQ